MFGALIKRLEGMRDKPGETYPLDAVERELLLDMLLALAKNSEEVSDGQRYAPREKRPRQSVNARIR
jgi:hypothetical protein